MHCLSVKFCIPYFSQMLMKRAYEFREQALKAKQEAASYAEENKELKLKIEQAR